MWRYDFTLPRIFHSVQVVICGIANWNKESVGLCVWRAALCWLEVVAVFEFQCSRYNSSKGNVFCFGKSQHGFTFSGSRLNLEVWCIAVDNVCS
jgi:hypothetical protein